MVLLHDVTYCHLDSSPEVKEAHAHIKALRDDLDEKADFAQVLKVDEEKWAEGREAAAFCCQGFLLPNWDEKTRAERSPTSLR